MIRLRVVYEGGDGEHDGEILVGTSAVPRVGEGFWDPDGNPWTVAWVSWDVKGGALVPSIGVRRRTID